MNRRLALVDLIITEAGEFALSRQRLRSDKGLNNQHCNNCRTSLANSLTDSGAEPSAVLLRVT